MLIIQFIYPSRYSRMVQSRLALTIILIAKGDFLLFSAKTTYPYAPFPNLSFNRQSARISLSIAIIEILQQASGYTLFGILNLTKQMKESCATFSLNAPNFATFSIGPQKLLYLDNSALAKDYFIYKFVSKILQHLQVPFSLLAYVLLGEAVIADALHQSLHEREAHGIHLFVLEHDAPICALDFPLQFCFLFFQFLGGLFDGFYRTLALYEMYLEHAAFAKPVLDIGIFLELIVLSGFFNRRFIHHCRHADLRIKDFLGCNEIQTFVIGIHDVLGHERAIVESQLYFKPSALSARIFVLLVCKHNLLFILIDQNLLFNQNNNNGFSSISTPSIVQCLLIFDLSLMENSETSELSKLLIQIIVCQFMMDFSEMQSSFKVLSRILLLGLIALFIAEMILRPLYPIPLIIILISYSTIICSQGRNSIFALRVVIIILFFSVIVNILELIYTCVGIQTGIFSATDQYILTKRDLRNKIIKVSCEIALTLYSLLLSWRMYERVKLETFLQPNINDE